MVVLWTSISGSSSSGIALKILYEKKKNVSFTATYTLIVLHLHRGAWEQPPRGAPGYRVLSDILFRLDLIANCSHTVPYLDCSDLNWRWNHYHFFGTVWPFWCWCAVKLWYHHHHLHLHPQDCTSIAPAFTGKIFRACITMIIPELHRFYSVLTVQGWYHTHFALVVTGKFLKTLRKRTSSAPQSLGGKTLKPESPDGLPALLHWRKYTVEPKSNGWQSLIRPVWQWAKSLIGWCAKSFTRTFYLAACLTRRMTQVYSPWYSGFDRVQIPASHRLYFNGFLLIVYFIPSGISTQVRASASQRMQCVTSKCVQHPRHTDGITPQLCDNTPVNKAGPDIARHMHRY